MDFSVGPDDTTTVVKMVRSLKDFLDKSPEPQRYQDQYDFSFDKNDSNNSSFKAPSFYSDSIVNPQSARKRSLLTISSDQKAEILYTKSKVSRLESELKTLETEKKVLEVEKDKYRKMEMYKKSKEYEECDSLRKALKELNSQKKGLEEELLEYKEKFKTLKENKEALKNQYTSQKDVLEIRLREALVANAEMKTDMKSKCARLEKELSKTTLSLNEAETHLKRFRDRQQENAAALSEYTELKYKCNQAEQRAKVLEEKLAKVDESALFMQKCQSELANYRKLEKENHKLREDNELYRLSADNALKLQEIIDMTKTKLHKAEDKLKQYQDVEFENQILKVKLDKWESHHLYGDMNIPRTPLELTRIISELQKSQLQMAEKHGELEASVTLQKSVLEEKTQEIEEATKEKSILIEQNKKLEDQYQKLQRRFTLVSTDRDGLRRVLSSYEKGEAEDMGSQSKQVQETINEYLNQVHQLEMQLSEARQEAAVQKTDYMKLQLEYEQLKSASMITDTSISNLAANQLEEIEKLKKQVKTLEEEKKTVTEERDNNKILYDVRLLQGGFNPLTTKAQSMSDNPLNLRRKKFLEESNAVLEENKKLKSKILKLQQQQAEQLDESMNLTKIIKSSKPMEDALKQVEAEKLKNQRLREQFSEAAKDFRLAIMEILGYNMKQEGSHKYSVRSCLSESRDDFFSFLLTEDESKENILSQLLETPFIEHWSELLKEYVEEGDSIPAFLAAVTLELFKESKSEMTNT